MKKRLISILLTLVLCFTLVTPAFAFDPTKDPDPKAFDFSQVLIYDDNGKAHSLTETASEVTVLIFGRDPHDGQPGCIYTQETFDKTVDVFNELGITGGSIQRLDVDYSDDYDAMFWLAVFASEGYVNSSTLPAVFVLDKDLNCIYYATYSTFDINAYRAALSAYSNAISEESIYNNTTDVTDIILSDWVLDNLDAITDSHSAADAVEELASVMPTAQKQDAGYADVAALYAENAAAKVASKTVPTNEILVSASTVAELAKVSAQVNQESESIMSENKFSMARTLSNMVTLTTNSTDEITIRVDPDILTTDADKVRIETPDFAIVLNMADLEEDLTEALVFTAESVGTGYGGGTASKKTTVQVKLPNGHTSNPITIALPTPADDDIYFQALVDTDGTASASKYNPVTTKIEGKVNTSGKYTVTTNKVDFSDISGKSAEMQNAIRYLASKGIINGATPTTFSPDGSISRAEIAALIVRALGWNDNSITSTFSDVTHSNWYYSAAASSQKHGLINGYPDNTFQGGTAISKEQILAVSSRVLVNKMGYKIPTNPSSYLTRYKDGVTNWAQGEVALATKENLVVYRVDGAFKGAGNMTRGDAAIVVYRLFQKIW